MLLEAVDPSSVFTASEVDVANALGIVTMLGGRSTIPADRALSFALTSPF